MSKEQIAPREWRRFLDLFSRMHEGWLVSVQIADASGTHHEIEDLPLVGVTSEQNCLRFVIRVGASPSAHVTHAVERPTALWLDRTADGADEALEMVADGTTTVVRFRSPMPAEMVDGLQAF
jgi:hypothetical protein